MADHHNQFDNLERDLRESLAARPAPDDFAEKVLARVANKEIQGPRLKRALLYRRESRPTLFLHWRSALAAVLIGAVLIAAGLWRRQRQQRIAGEHARAQVMLALRITSNTLDTILQQNLQHPAKEAQP